jgi:hypothetical protein
MNHNSEEKESFKESDTQSDLNGVHVIDNPTQSTTNAANNVSHEPDYVTGIKLWSLLAALTLVLFLMMLDMSIVVTVSFHMLFRIPDFYRCHRQFLESRPTFIRCLMLAGTGARISYLGLFISRFTIGALVERE